MREFRRVYRKKFIMFLLVLCLFNMGLFLLSVDSEKKITLEGQELEEYISSYPAFLESTAENSRVLATLNMYKEGFASDSLQKAADSYGALEGIRPETGENRGIILLIQYKLSDAFLLVFLALVATDFLSERQKGLVQLVRSTGKGRGVLYVQRTGILFFSALAGAVLLNGGSFLAMRVAYGEPDLSRCIQSLPEFMKCPYALSIGEYLVLSAGIRAVGCFLWVYIFFLLISVLSAGAAYLVTAVTAVAEILLSLLISPVSSINSLKFVNLFTAVLCENYFQDHCLLNIFGRAVPAWKCLVVFFCVAALALFATGMLIHGKRYVVNRKAGERLAEKIAHFREKHAVQHTHAGWEAYKLLVKQGAFLVILLAFGLHLFMSGRYSYLYYADAMERLWYYAYEGELTEEKLTEAKLQLDTLENAIASLKEKYQELSRYGNQYGEQVMKLRISIQEKEELRDGMLPVVADMQDGMEYTRRTGNKIQVIAPYTYDLLFRIDQQTKNRACFFILIGVIGAVSGVCAFDTQNHMRYSMRSLAGGRRRTMLVKTGLVLGVCFLISTLLHLVQIYQIGLTMEYKYLSAPVQSLSFMRDFGLNVTILEYIVILFLVRGMVACGIGMICMAVSRLCTDTITAVGVSAFLLTVPVLVAQLFPEYQMFNTLYLLSADFVH